MNSRDIEAAVLEKIAVMTPPVDCCVIPETTPVVSFGDFSESKIATLGINPSPSEFLSQGNLIRGKAKRLSDQEYGPASPMDIWFKCKHYFQGNPYWSWFSHLEELLLEIGGSYKTNACHLDLSPWATNPIFRNLSSRQKSVLLENDQEFLPWQLANSPIKTILFNGGTVYQTINQVKAFNLEKVSEIKFSSGGTPKTSDLVSGTGPNGVAVYGWTLNLQALQVTVEERKEIVDQLVKWLQQECKIVLEF